jgi:hypothetical protein
LQREANLHFKKIPFSFSFTGTMPFFTHKILGTLLQISIYWSHSFSTVHSILWYVIIYLVSNLQIFHIAVTNEASLQNLVESLKLVNDFHLSRNIKKSKAHFVSWQTREHIFLRNYVILSIYFYIYLYIFKSFAELEFLVIKISTGYCKF